MKKSICTSIISLIVLCLSWLQTEISIGFDHIFLIEIKYVFLNISTLLVIWGFCFLLFNRTWICNLFLSIITTGISIANHYVLEFKNVPLSFFELKNFKTAMNVVSSYTFAISKTVIFLLLILAFCLLLTFLSYYLEKYSTNISKNKRFKRNMSFGVFLLIIMCWGYCGENPIKPQKTIGWLWSEAYQKYGYIACTIESFVSSFDVISIPDGYSDTKIENFYVHITTKEQDISPDIILILNETFYDLGQITELQTDCQYLENYYELNNIYTGYSVVPSSGGGTNSSEYELLTSNSLQLMPGITPFNNLDLAAANSIVSHLNKLGYDTLGSHPEPAVNYLRNIGYSALKFNHIFFDSDFIDKEYYESRWYETDRSLYNNLNRWYETEMLDCPRFLYLLTIQNHGEWNLNPRKYDLVHATKDFGQFDEDIDEFLTCIQMTDHTFKELTDYYSTVDRPVIICMMGDHSPTLANEIIDQTYSEDEKNLLLRKTPLIIWANYDLGINDYDLGTMSMNYVIPTLLEMAGVKLSPYYQYMLNLKEEVPILTSYGVYYDKQGHIYSYNEETKYSDAVNQYFYLEYNNLSDHRIQSFFDPFEE